MESAGSPPSSETGPRRPARDPVSSLAPLGLAIGAVIDRRYRVEGVIGAGGQGIVLEVTHLDLGERRAIKLMRPRDVGDPAALQRFLREARAAGSLVSPHVVRVFDVGRLEDGAPFLVMERLHGTDLRRHVAERGRLAPSEAVGLALQALRGLALAHESGLVHRDIKPSNLFLCETAGRPLVKILDFGLARRPRGASLASEPGEVTLGSDIVGSPRHMAPEQMRDARTVDARADLWAMGTVLYTALAGDTPFHGDTVADILAAVLTRDPPPLRALRADVSPALEAVILACLHKRAEPRPASARALAEALLAALTDEERREAEAWAEVSELPAAPSPRLESAERELPSRGLDPPTDPGDVTRSAQGAVGPPPEVEGPPPARAGLRGPPAYVVIAAITAVVTIGGTLGAVRLWPSSAPANAGVTPSKSAPPAASSPVLRRSVPPHTQATLEAALRRGGWSVKSAVDERRGDVTTIVVVAEAGPSVLKLEYDLFPDEASALLRAQDFSAVMRGRAPAIVDGPRVLAWAVSGAERDANEAAKGWALVEVLTARTD